MHSIPSASDITHIAELAKIMLTQQEIGGFIKKQQMVLDYIDQLQKAVTNPPGSPDHQSMPVHPLRDDTVTCQSGPHVRELLLGPSPLRDGDVIKIVGVFK